MNINQPIKQTAKVIARHPKHMITMINFNWKCCNCEYENSASLSEEEDLCQVDKVILTCSNCRFNNRILLKDIYNNDF